MSTTDRIIPIPLKDEMESSYLSYAMSVIVSRALPDARDGLKPVHRRILYAMYEQGYTPDKKYRKCAAAVGDVMKSYHPHGDASIYDALVRLAQPFNMRYPLIDPQGNFGSIDGDPPASMRYTEAKLGRLAMEMLADIDKDTVDWRPNYDNTVEEPKVLPARLPNLLVNGSAGIAVGMATNMAPHNLREVCDAITFLIDNPTCTDDELIDIVPAPDFPTGGLILGTEGARMAYLTGRGSVTMRARTSIEELRANKSAIIVTEIPYQVNKTRLIEQIADLVKEKKVQGITDLRDESDRRGMRIVIELSAAARPQVVLNQLFKHTALQQNFGINNLALVDEKRPRTLTLRQMLDVYIKHRKEVIERRSRYELEKARKRAHILEGLLKALDILDEIITLIRASANVEDARGGLMSQFAFSEEQANAILDMRLQRLTGLEREKLTNEHEEVRQTIAYLEGLLASTAAILGVVKDETADMKARFGDARRSEIVAGESGAFDMEDLIPPTDIIVTVSHAGYVKRMPVAAYKAQRRGGRGVSGTGLRDEDYLEHILATNTHHFVLFFTNRARVYRLKGWEIPEAARQAKGTALVNKLDIEPGEKVMAVIPVADFNADAYLFMATEQGTVKKTALSEFVNLRARGLIALTLEDGDALVGVRLTTGNDHIMLVTHSGLSLRFPETDVRSMGRGARGVKGINLREDDGVVSMANAHAGSEVLIITEDGFGKKTPLDEYRLQSRGGYGVRGMNLGKGRRGQVAAARILDPENQLILSTQDGIVIRIKASDVSTQSRHSQGVRLMRVSGGDKVSSVAVIPPSDEIDDEEVDALESRDDLEGLQSGEVDAATDRTHDAPSDDSPSASEGDTPPEG
ncbi:MAG: DNA gyrase subunit A [Proteobacteria bacterium]|nr:DNA gyrase subunit A [Pseudomonadota bacterium]